MNADERLALSRLKIERAEKHLVELNAEIGTFLATKPYRVIKKVDPKVVYEVSHVTPLPGSIPAIVGDAVQRARARARR
jgi:hypothetical protein